MKIISLILLFLPQVIISQTSELKSLQELKTSVKNSEENFQDINFNLNFNISDTKKSVGLGIIYSLLLPGMGELYADAYDVGKYFTIADGVLWGTFIGMNSYASWQKDNYQTYAASRAGVDNNNKDADYYARIGEYTSIETYNDQKALERNFIEMYDDDKYFWKWNSTEERRTYRDMWTSSEQTSNDIRFVVGGLILNRVASAINAARLVTSYNKRLAEEVSWNFSVGFMNQPNLPTSVSFNFQKSF
ncbi:MAG: hypothetical protein WBN42_11770 [Ignavibacteriaceae bacterium]